MSRGHVILLRKQCNADIALNIWIKIEEKGNEY